MIWLDDGTHKEEAFGIWQRNFHDPVLYAKFYFDEVYGKNQVYFNPSEEEDEIRGMLHLNPYKMRVKGKALDLHYIVGVSTEEDYRRQGVMRELLLKSMTDMRNAGEPFTYLMPADEVYYLPFDFRFGMAQVEQEVLYHKNADVTADKEEQELSAEDAFAYLLKKKTAKTNPELVAKDHDSAVAEPSVEIPSYNGISFIKYQDYVKGFEDGTLSSYDDLNRICQKECAEKDDTFAIFTEITPAYLERLMLEAESDFGKMILAFRDGRYVGRFVSAAEYSYLIISQVFCAAAEDKKNFLQAVLDYCIDHFGDYGNYQLILDESWKDELLKAGPYGGNRVMPMKLVDKIMFRILNLVGMEGFISLSDQANVNTSCTFAMEDPFLVENSGIYRFDLGADQVKIVRIDDEIADDVDGHVTIAEFTEVLFGDKKACQLACYEACSQAGKDFLDAIVPLRKTCVMEIV